MSGRYAIVGAGISGLAAAVRLLDLAPDAEIVVFEGATRPGGKILTESIDGFTIEGGPDAFLGSKPGGVALCRAVGIDDELVGPIAANRRSFVMRQGRLAPLPEGLSGLVPGRIGPMLRSPLLSPLGKARMLGDFVLPPRADDGDESLASFVTRRVGPEMYERMVEPLLAGIYGGDGTQLSLAATFPQFRTAETTHRGWLRAAVAQQRASKAQPAAPGPRGFLGFDRGMSRIVDASIEHLASQGVDVRLDQPVRAIGPGPVEGGFRLETDAADESFDGVIVATPAWATSPLLASVAPDASATLAEIEHGSSALVAIGFPASQLSRPLHGYGYVVPRIENRRVMAMTWVSSKWSHRAPGDQVLVRGFFGRFGREEILASDDATLVSYLRDEMRDVLGFDVTPTLSRVYRWDRGMPQYNLGHRERVARIESALAQVPGVEIAGNYLRGVGIPDSITSGQAAAERLVESRGTRRHAVATTAGVG